MTKTLMLAAIVAIGAMLVGCDSKPPGCADTETLQTAKRLVTDPLRPERPEEADPDGIGAGFDKALKLDVQNIVSEGYQADKKKQMCKGMLRITLPDGRGLEREIEYSTQRTVDQKDRFMLQIENIQPVILQLSVVRSQYVDARRWTGNWGGTYSCSGVGGASDGPQGPFSMPVTMVVDGNDAKLERVTKGDGVETLKGTLSGALSLAGTGANSADDRWETTFHGEAKGRKATAEGLIRIAGGPILRHCKLDLTQGAVATASPAVPATGTAPATAASPSAVVSASAPATGSTPAAVQAPPVVSTPVATLCTTGEQVVFSCSTGKKLVSLCASPNLTAEAGSMTYRVGNVGQPPEMQYPDAGVRPQTAFKQGSQTYVGGSVVFVSFVRDEYRYVVFSGSGKGWTKEGVLVEKAGKRIAHLACAADAQSVLDEVSSKVLSTLPPDGGGLQLP